MTAQLKKFTLWLACLLGREFRDERTGASLGRAFALMTPGGATFVGLPHAVRPVFLSETGTKYTKHRIGFQRHAHPDYPSLQPESRHISPGKILWAILVHQTPGEVSALLRHWESLGYSAAHMLFVHAGAREDFDALIVPNKIFVADQAIRTTFHPMEKQSYGGALREIAAWLGGRDCEAVALVEYDHLPLIADGGSRLCELLDAERADLLCHHLMRVDGTNASHYLHHLSDRRFAELWQVISMREDKEVFLNAVMTGSFWRRGAFEAVAAQGQPFPVYLELYLPSLAHHLGFRVRNYGFQDRFVQVIPMEQPFSPKWQAEGAWSLHQVKNLS